MKLYGSDQSGHSYKVRLFLALAQIVHEYIYVDLMLGRKDRPCRFYGRRQTWRSASANRWRPNNLPIQRHIAAFGR